MPNARKNLLPILLAVIVILSVGLAGLLVYQNHQLEQKLQRCLKPLTYTNGKYGYSFKYPAGCSHGPLPAGCKQNPPEERPQECLCFLNGENPDGITLQAFTGEQDNLILASAWLSYFDLLPPNADFITWLKAQLPNQDVPDEINAEIGGVPAVKIYIPPSPQSYSLEDLYFVKDSEVFKLSLSDVDNTYNRALYDEIIASFGFTE